MKMTWRHRRKGLQRQRGVAIILVLGAITILSALAVDFGLESDIQMRLALAERDRLQAEYLARSGINFLRLLMVKEASLKGMITQLSGGAIDPTIPICKQFPLSTEMLRALFGLGASGAPAEEGTPTESGEEGEAAEGRLITAFDTAAAAEFLSFRGDFEGECADESGKLNLNVFAQLNPLEATIGGMNRYDRAKFTLQQFLERAEVKALFGDHPEEQIADAVRNIADWIDPDDAINDRPGVQGGAEHSAYNERDTDFHIRNGKMVTLDEAYLVAGVTDEWFAPLRPYLTVYGKEKLNICLAEPAVIEALVLSYAANNDRIPPVSRENTELIQRVLDAIATLCAELQPSVQTITQQVEAILMGQAVDAETGAPTGAGPTTPSATAGGTFADWIDLAGGPYRLIGTGRVPSSGGRETVVTIELVLDKSAQDPQQWKLLYWNME
ncbi:MAG: general secretion pathway protein GspK [Deltaproteobacteria bacterium]|nr:general secretion pathway protein GspK [Deltaproteobacteria bacterium]